MHIQMKSTKPYVVAIIVQAIYAGTFVILKAAFNKGFSTYVFNFYCQAAASVLLLPIVFFRERKNVCSMTFGLLLKLFLCGLIGNTFSINLLNVALRFTSATVQSAIGNSKPAITFCFALLLRMESVRLSSPYGIAKVTGVVICLAGVFVIAFYAGPAFSPVNHHHPFHASHTSSNPMGRATWIKGTFLRLLGDIIWCLWIIAQAALLKEFPNKILVTVTQCVFSTVQSLVVAAVAERDCSRWKLGLDVSLLGVIYMGFIVTGVGNYLQVWCLEMKGPVFVNTWFPLCFVLTMFCSAFFLWEIVHLGSILGGILTVIEPCNNADMTFREQDKIEERKSEDNMKGREEEKEVSTCAV